MTAGHTFNFTFALINSFLEISIFKHIAAGFAIGEKRVLLTATCVDLHCRVAYIFSDMCAGDDDMRTMEGSYYGDKTASVT